MLRPAALLALVPFATGAQTPPVVSIAPAPSTPPAPPTEGASAQTWAPGQASCGGAPIAPVFVARPQPAIVYGASVAAAPVTFRFTVDETGRSMDIVKLGTEWSFGSEDVAPALAATRFAAGAPRQDCRVTYGASRTSFEETPTPELLELSFRPRGEVAPWPLWNALHPASSCDRPPLPAEALRGFPDHDKVVSQPGVVSYSLVGFDLDRGGRPRGAHMITGTGNDSLDRASIRAVQASRFYNHAALTGCRYAYAQKAATLEAPQGPKAEVMRPIDSTCPGPHRYAVAPRLTYPQPFQRRAIEGWAIIGYDVAPWGELGNMRVLAAEPAEAFGEWGKQVLSTARLPASATGRVGCVDKVVFRIGDRPGVTVTDPISG